MAGRLSLEDVLVELKGRPVVWAKRSFGSMFVLGLGVRNRTGVSPLEMRGVRRRRPIGEWTFIIQDCF